MADISVIIPCYNSGVFLMEAIQSVETYRGKYQYEIIIVDDGSTEEGTVALLDQLRSSGYKILHQQNCGPAAARNAGCKIAGSAYLLFLDSDNKIYPGYIDIGISYLDADERIAVVYGNPTVFGDNSRAAFESEPFDISKLMAFNYIDVCSVVRKKAWSEVGGFDEDRTIIEDWEFWIRLYKAGWLFRYVDQDLYYYRIREHSLGSIAIHDRDAKLKMYKKHADLLSDLYISLFKKMELQKKDLNWSIRYRIKQLISKFKRA